MGQVQTDKGGSFGPVYQNHLALWIVLKGKTTAIVDGESFQVKQGQAGFFYAHSVHKLQYDTSEVSYLWCASALLPDVGFIATKESIEQLHKIPNVLKPSKVLRDLMWLGAGMQNRQGLAADRVRTTIGESAFNEFFYLANLHEEDNAVPVAVSKARRYILASFGNPSCKSQDIAAAASMSSQHLTKLFKRYMNCTPVKYLWQLRGERAIHLLKYSNQNSSEIASQCGFKDPFHFSRFIKMEYGLSPRQIRKRSHAHF